MLINPGNYPSRSIAPSIRISAELDAVYEHSLSLLSSGASWERANVIASKVMFYLHLEKPEQARSVFESARSSGFTIDSDLRVVERMLLEKEATGRDGPEGHLKSSEYWKLLLGREGPLLDNRPA
jgi:hypothetical protein